MPANRVQGTPVMADKNKSYFSVNKFLSSCETLKLLKTILFVTIQVPLFLSIILILLD